MEAQLLTLLEQFKKRKAANANHPSNASLPAGSPMYYYCEYCRIKTDTLGEEDFYTTPVTICAACQFLEGKELLTEKDKA